MKNIIFMRIDGLMKSQKRKIKDLLEYLGVNRSTYDNWRKGTSKSYMNHLSQISLFLGVTPNYFLSDTEFDTMPICEINDPREVKLVTSFRLMKTNTQDLLLGITEEFVHNAQA